MSLLEIANLRKTFGDFVAVNDVSLTIQEGEIFGLLGPNGAGKTTTMSMVAGLLPADSGTITLDGKVLTEQSRDERTVLGIVPQDLAIYPELTARENLDFFGKLYGIDGPELKKRVDSALQRIGLTDRANDFAGNYSGGMKRRLNFGIALLHEPKLLILDEPTVGVDPQSRAHLLDCVRDLRKEGVASIYASHYMEEVESICDRVAIMDKGNMLICDTLDTLLGHMSSDIHLRIGTPAEKALESINELADRISVTSHNGDTTLTLTQDPDRRDGTLSKELNHILEKLGQNKVVIQSIDTDEPNLERLFLKLTGTRLRD